MKLLVEKAYAKINLNLNVLGKRLDNYHELKSVMTIIDLYDLLIFEEADTLVYEPFCENDLVLKTASLFLETYNITNGVKITLEKNIPLGAGLAGGSADAAAVIRGLSKFFDLNLDYEEMNELAMKLGSDISFCLKSNLALVTGRGEFVKRIRANQEILPLNLIVFPFELSTKDVFNNYQNVNLVDNTSLLVEALKNNSLLNNLDLLNNDLLSAALKTSIQFKELYIKIKENNQVFLSGSGPTLFSFNEVTNLPSEVKVIKTRILF